MGCVDPPAVGQHHLLVDVVLDVLVVVGVVFDVLVVVVQAVMFLWPV